MPKQNSRTLRKIKNNPELLNQMGYCRISNSRYIVARIDQADWKERLLQYWKDGLNNDLTIAMLAVNAEDHYRRSLSEDQIAVSKEVYLTLPSSTGCNVGYVTEDGAEESSTIVLVKSDEMVVKKSEYLPRETLTGKFMRWVGKYQLVNEK